MSLLYRHNVGRNDIAWGGGTSTVGNYLQRTGSGRTNIRFYTIPQSNATYNLMERYNNTRNGIRWNNITFTFASGLQTLAGLYTSSTNGINCNCYINKNGTRYCYILSTQPNSYNRSSYVGSVSAATGTIVSINLKYSSESNATNVYNYIKSHYSRITVNLGDISASGNVSESYALNDNGSLIQSRLSSPSMGSISPSSSQCQNLQYVSFS